MTDLVLAVFGLAGLAVVCFFIFFAEFAPVMTSGTAAPTVATTSALLGEVRRRPMAALAWDDLRFGASVRRRDTVFVPPEGELLLAFQDGSELHIEENSLVVIEFRSATTDDQLIDDAFGLLAAETGAGLTVEVIRGGVSGRTTSDQSSITIQSSTSVTRLTRTGEARVRVKADQSTNVYVVRGTAKVSSGDQENAVPAGTVQEVSADGVLATPEHLKVVLTRPAAGERLYIQTAVANVQLGWEPVDGFGPYVVQLAEDSGFSTIIASLRTKDVTQGVQVPGPGVYFWRVGRRGEARNLRSEERRLVVIDDTPPVLLTPRHGQIVYAPGGGEVGFSWSSVGFAQGYRLVVARDRALEKIVFEQRTTVPSFWQPTDEMPEGVYHWRVHVTDSSREETPRRRAFAFRLITRPLPTPPELFDSELLLEGSKAEVEHGSFAPLRWLLGPDIAHAQGAKKTRHRLRWSAVPGITKYELQIADDAAFKKVVHTHTLSVTYYEWTPPSLERDYHWRVRSIDAEGRPGIYAPPKVMRAPNRGPTPTALKQTVLFGKKAPDVTLAWEGAERTPRYEVQIAPGAKFTDVLVRLDVRKANTVKWTPPAPKLFHWRVRAIDAAGRTSVWGKIAKIDVRLEPPRPISPRAGQAFSKRGGQATVRFEWAPREADAYEVQVALKKSFERVVETLAATSESAVYKTKRKGPLFWRVRARDASGRWSGWSAASPFKVVEASLLLLEPLADAKIPFQGSPPPVRFDWEPVPKARRYVVEITPSAASGSPRKIHSPTPGIDEKPLPAGAYEWSVVALDRRGRVLTRSATQTFSLVDRPLLPAPQPTAPVDGALLVSRKNGTALTLALRWSSVAGATEYEVTVTGASGPGGQTRSTNESHLDIIDLDDGEYAWRVRAKDGNGFAGHWSSSRRFGFWPLPIRSTVQVDPNPLRPASEATVRVQLFDDADKLVPGQRIDAEVSIGELGAFRDEGGTYVATMTVPRGSGGAQSVLSLHTPTGFHAKHNVPIEALGSAFVGPLVGMTTNLASQSLVYAGFEVGYRPALLNGRSFVTLSLMFAQASTPLADASGTLTGKSTLRRIPIRLGVGFRPLRSRFSPYASLGFVTEFYLANAVLGGAPAARTNGILIGGALAVGVEGKLGPGRILLDVSFGQMLRQDGAFNVGGRWLTATAGYRWRVW